MALQPLRTVTNNLSCIRLQLVKCRMELVNWDSIFHPVPQNSPPCWNKRVLAIHCHMGGGVQVLSQVCGR